MYLNQFKRVARHYLDAGITVELKSAPGIGKSETIEQLVKEYSERDGFQWGLSVAMLATYTPPDLLGYLMPDVRNVEQIQPDGSKVLVPTKMSSFTMPPWMISVEGKPMNSYRRGIVFLDEYDKADPDVKRASAEILLNGGVGPWQLNDGIGVIAASNRSEDRSGSTKSYDFVINRRGEIEIQPDVNSWEDWAVRNGVHPFFVAFAKSNVEVVFSGKVPDKQGPFCTPRSLVNLSRLLAPMATSEGHFPIGSKDEELMLLELATGMVGAGAANQLVVWMKTRTEVPDFNEIVAKPDKVKVPAKPDGKMLVCYDCAHRVSHTTVEPVVDYIMRLPPEFQVLFGAAAIKRDHRLIATPAFRNKFTKVNTSLLNLINEK
jgi:hypothetical protein